MAPADSQLHSPNNEQESEAPAQFLLSDSTERLNDNNLPPQDDEPILPVVGLGGSAGSIGALQEFFGRIPTTLGIAYVVVVHLASDFESQLPQVLGARTRMPVVQVQGSVKVEADHVYVIPPAHHLRMDDGHIHLSQPEQERGQRVAVDLFFRTLAASHRSRAVAVVLSGLDGDGTIGIKRIKEHGGVTIAQDPDEAEQDGMPRSAIDTGMVDWILSVEQMAGKIAEWIGNERKIQLPPAQSDEAAPPLTGEEADETALREVLGFLHTRTGHDFSHYKRATVLRRILRRLQVNSLENLPHYATFLRTHPGEAGALLQDLLISVTNFFRDPEAFLALEALVPRFFRDKKPSDAVRVWVAGCATGEEAYSLAMLLDEHAQTLDNAPEIQIFATDLDEQALRVAREGTYSATIAADVSPDRLRRYFMLDQGRYRVKKDLRERVLFAAHNLLRDSPFSRLDLVSCRNLLIYFNREAQDKVLDVFHFALRPGGTLFLGGSESADDNPMFRVGDKKHRLYECQAVRRSHLPVLAAVAPLPPRAVEMARFAPAATPIPTINLRPEAAPSASYSELHLRLLEQSAPPSVLVNANYDIVHLSEHAGQFLHLAGEATMNVLSLVHPALRLELRTALFRAVQTGEDVNIPAIPLELNGRVRRIGARVRSMREGEENNDFNSFVLVIFDEEKDAADTPPPLPITPDATARRLEDELHYLKTQLRVSVEQYEASSEELKASNEELQAMNEEQRSAAEELETSREEIQAANEELSTVNAELKLKIEEISRSNADLQNLMSSTDIATVFLSRDLQIKRYTPRAVELFRLIPTDIGRPLADLRHGFGPQSLTEDADRVLRTLATVEREVSSDDGHWFLLRVSPYRTLDDRIDGVVLTFVDVTSRKRAEEEVRASEERLQRAIGIETVGVLFFNNSIEITDCNDAFVRMSGYSREELRMGRFSWEVFTPDGFAEVSSRAIEELNTSGITTPYEKQYIRKDGTRFWAMFAAKRISDNEIVEFVTDITEQKRAEEEVRESEARRHLALEAAELGTFLYHPREDRGEPDARMLALFGLKEGDMLNLADALDKMIYSGDREFYAAEVAKAVDPGGDGKLYAEIRVVHPDKSIHWLAITAQTTFEGIPPQPAGMYGTAVDISERKRAEEIQAFRLKLSEALRPLSDPVAVQETAMQVLGRQLGVNRAFYGEVLDDEDTIVFNPGYAKELSLLTGQMKFSEFDTDMMNDYRAGQTVVLNDIGADVQFTEKAKSQFDAIQVRAAVGVPLVKNNKVRAILSIHQSVPRNWTPDEIKILEETAERTWAAVTRARAEEALAASEEKYRTLFDSIDEGVATIEMIFDVSGKPIDFRVLEVNPAYERVTGLTSDVVGHRIREYLPFVEDDLIEFYGQVALTGEPLRVEQYVSAFDRWFNAYASRVGGEGSRMVAVVFNNISERKRAEEALRESEARLRVLTENLPGGAAFIVDRDLRYLAASGEAFVAAGFSSEDFVGRPLSEALPPELAAEYEPNYRKALAGQSYEIEHEAHGRTFLSRGVPLKRENGDIYAVLAVSYDITERKDAEDAVRRSEAQLRTLTDEVPQIIWTNDAPGNANLFNSRWFEYSGRSLEESLGLGWQIIVHPDDAPASVERWNQALSRGEVFDTEYRLRRRDGEYRWFIGRNVPLKDQDGQVTGWFGTATDINDIKEAEVALRESSERFRAMFEQATAGVAEYDLQGLHIFANQTFCDALGYSCEELLRLTLRDITYADDWPHCHDIFERAKAQGGSFLGEKRLIRKDGEIIWVAESVSGIRDGDEQTHSVVAVSIDITQRKRAEDELQRSHELLETRVELRTQELARALAQIRAEVEQRRRLEEARTELMKRIVNTQEDERGRISRELHDNLGQHLTAVMLGLQALETQVQSLTDGDRDALMVRLHSLRSLVDGLMKAAHRQAWELRPAELDAMGLEAALGQYLRHWSERTHVHIDFQAVGWENERPISAVETTLYRVVQEALTNVARHANASQVSVVLELSQSGASVIIEDNGRGFDTEEDTKRLGLLGMRERLSTVNGTLDIESIPKDGTTIFAHVPLAHN